MKQCVNCGKQSSDEAKFCVSCGGGNFVPVAQPIQYRQPPKKKRKAGKIILIVLGSFVALMVISSLFSDPESDTANNTTTESFAETTTVTTTTTTAAPTSTPGPTPTPEPTLSDEERRAIYSEVDYKSVARNPSEFQDSAIVFTGTVIQVMEGDYTQLYRIAQDDDYDQIWYVEFYRSADEPRILEDDTVTVYGLGSGLVTYETTTGTTVSIPGIISFDIVIHE